MPNAILSTIALAERGEDVTGGDDVGQTVSQRYGAVQRGTFLTV